jgi:DNA-binding MarR family transcriptional regulator
MIWRLSTKWRTEIDRRLAPLELTHAQYALLASLYGLTRSGARPSQRELADFSGFEAIYVSKLIRALDRDGLVKRTASPSDSRAVELELTEQGEERTRGAMSVVRSFLDEALRPIGGADGELNRILMRTLETLLTGSREGD